VRLGDSGRVGFVCALVMQVRIRLRCHQLLARFGHETFLRSLFDFVVDVFEVFEENARRQRLQVDGLYHSSLQLLANCLHLFVFRNELLLKSVHLLFDC